MMVNPLTRTDSLKLAGRLGRGAVCSGGSCSPSAEAPPACKAGEHKGIHTSNHVEMFLKDGDDPCPFQIPKGTVARSCSHFIFQD